MTARKDTEKQIAARLVPTIVANVVLHGVRVGSRPVLILEREELLAGLVGGPDGTLHFFVEFRGKLMFRFCMGSLEAPDFRIVRLKRGPWEAIIGELASAEMCAPQLRDLLSLYAMPRNGTPN